MAASTSAAPRITVRIEPDCAVELEAIARASHRSVAGEVRHALELHLAQARRELNAEATR